ncbi:VOC family protein [Novosphingobium aquimarinum]|uniref:VOC family protein n=1 Tax=Novosphingobium aquimarinum TaxID=2682494 RepID=UPI0012EBF574|nr:VOC family protein [Novosphingobium aquimarinum]
MTVGLNHTIVWSSDRHRASEFFARIFALPAPVKVSRFQVVTLDNGVSLDFADTSKPIATQHYAMLVSEPEFDGIYARIREEGIPHWSDPGRTRPDEINHNHGGRGVYFTDPDGHVLEALTVPYGGAA